MIEPLVQFRSASRRFGELLAVDQAKLDVFAGEVLAVLGENGAGKSTLMKMLYGVHPPTSGEIFIGGRPSAISGPASAMQSGVGMVFQNFSLLPALSVRDNLLLAWPRTPFWKSRRNRRTAGVLDTLNRLAPQIDPGARVGDLSVGEQQIVELCKVLNISARIVILDEPTSVLTPDEAERLHGFVRRLAADGVAVVLITHKLADVEACADRIAVMRRGRIEAVSRRGEKTMQEIVALMMGKPVERKLAPPPAPSPRVPRLVLQEVTADTAGSRIEAVSVEIGKGEIVGVAGVAGNGQTLLAETVAGIHPLASGEVLLDGERIGRRTPFEAVSTPIGYVPEDPRRNALVETMTLAENLSLRRLAAGGTAPDSQMPLLQRFDVRPPEPRRAAGTLSGGNVQKLVSARELGQARKAVLACYPTMGLDLAAIENIYAEIFARAAEGAAVLWISEDLDDLIAAAHRIAVLREGRIVAILDNDGTLTRERLGALMTGMAPDRTMTTTEPPANEKPDAGVASLPDLCA